MNYLLTNQETDRLTFRTLEKSDFDEWMELFEAENADVFLGMKKGLSNRELCEIWFDKCFTRLEDGRGGMNVLMEKKTKKMVGQCGLLIQTIAREKRLEIGYSILPKYWGKGFATEAAQKHKDFAFENNLWKDLVSMVHVDNIASEKVAIKNGMTLEKTITEEDGNRFNIFTITKEKWLQNQ